MFKSTTNPNPQTVLLEEECGYLDDPNAEYFKTDGTAKSTTYVLLGYAPLGNNKVVATPSVKYYANDDFDAYVRSNETMRKHMLTGDMRADNEFLSKAEVVILKPHRVDPADGQTIHREFSKADMPRMTDFSKVSVEAA